MLTAFTFIHPAHLPTAPVKVSMQLGLYDGSLRFYTRQNRIPSRRLHILQFQHMFSPGYGHFILPRYLLHLKIFL